jgi:hypothetical protein
VHHLEDRQPQDGEVDLGDAVELPVVRQDLMRASISAMCAITPWISSSPKA